MMSKYRIRPEIVHLDASSLYFEGAYEGSTSSGWSTAGTRRRTRSGST